MHMKKALLVAPFAVFALQHANAQISITAADMPVSGDTLRSTLATATIAQLNLANTGANITWDYSSLTGITQSIDAYKTAIQVNPAYALTISPTAYGYKVADSLGTAGLPVTLPVTISNIYTFFNKKNSPSRYVAEGFAAEISGFPTPGAYSDEDEWYFFPLNYGSSQDSSTYKLTLNVLTLGSLKIAGYRKTTVDGWGTIKTPYYATPISCLRVRTETNETDSITSPLGTFGFPRKTVEYKWLANGEHYPALWVTTDETTGTPNVTTVRYRDVYRPELSVIPVNKQYIKLLATPTPAAARVQLALPTEWKHFSVTVVDVAGRVVLQQSDERVLDIHAFPSGQYMSRVVCGEQTGFVPIVKQ